MATEVTELKTEDRCDLRGCLEATMVSKTTITALRCNVHMDARVIKCDYFKSEARCVIRGSLFLLPARESKGPLPSCLGQDNVVSLHFNESAKGPFAFVPSLLSCRLHFKLLPFIRLLRGAILRED